MFQYLKYFTIALKVAPCLIKGFENYETAKESSDDVTPKEWTKIVENIIKCILSKFDVPEDDKVIVENLFNEKEYKIKLR